jgi:predicted DNA-binding transcriptional regulator AlpA
MQANITPQHGRVFTLKTLPEKGITFSPNHIRRLVAAGRFPKPFRLSERRPAWSEATLDRWIAAREAERDEGAVEWPANVRLGSPDAEESSCKKTRDDA